MVRGNQKRHLKEMRGRFYYNRAVPVACQFTDPRFPRVQTALKTASLAEALLRRDVLERQDDELWAALQACQSAEEAREAYEAAMKLRQVFKLPRNMSLPTSQNDTAALEHLRNAIKAVLPIQEAALRQVEPVRFGDLSGDRKRMLREIEGRAIPEDEALMLAPESVSDPVARVAAALLGQVEKPRASVTEAMEYYIDTIARADWSGKSEAQARIWKNDKLRAAKTFANVCGEVALLDVTDDDARTFFEYLEGRMLNPEERFGYDAAKRQLGDMKLLFREYTRRLNIRRENPFAHWQIKRPGKMRKRKQRPPFSIDWITNVLLRSEKLLRMDAERRRAFFVILETGARPGEIINLLPERIHLDAVPPYLEIDTIEDGENRRELKTVHSIRKVPLVGVALAAMQKQPEGFPTLRDKSNAFSAAVNKFLRENGLMESDSHSVYSARHSAEDRLKAGAASDDMRRQILGHKIDREEYGQRFTVAQIHDVLLKICLPFDPAII